MSNKVKLTSEQIAFLRLVKKTIQEEIRQQLDEVVEQVAQRILSEMQVSDSSRNSNKHTELLTSIQNESQRKKTHWNSGNPILDSVMSETEVNPNGSFGFSDKYGSMMDPTPMTTGNTIGVNANTPGVDGVLKEALTRDYSSLMKAIQKDQKRKGKA